MSLLQTPTQSRSRATNITLNTVMLDEARALKINISRACEQGLAEQIRQAKAAKWLEANKEAIDESNAYVEKHGLPLAKYRQF